MSAPNFFQSWCLLENLLKLRQEGEKDESWSDMSAALAPVVVDHRLKDCVKSVASSGCSQFLQEWMMEEILQDLNENVAPTFWQNFGDGAVSGAARQHTCFCNAVQYLHNVYSLRYMVVLRRLRWLQTLARSAPAQEGVSQSAFTPVKTGAIKPSKGLNFGSSMGQLGALRPGKGDGLSVTFEEGTKGLQADSIDDSLEGFSFAKGMDGSYLNNKQQCGRERSLWSNSSHNVSNISEMNLSKSMAAGGGGEKVEEEEESDYFIRSPIPGYKQGAAEEMDSIPHIKPTQAQIVCNLFKQEDMSEPCEKPKFQSGSSVSAITSTPGHALVHVTPGITPICCSDSTDVFDNDMIGEGNGEMTSDETMSVQEALSKESVSGEHCYEVLPSIAEVFGGPGRAVGGGSERWTGFDASVSHSITPAIKNKVSLMMKSVLFNTFPPNFIAAVKDFYTAAFIGHRQNLDNSSSLLTEEDADSTQTQVKSNEINTKLEEMGLMQLVSGLAVTEIVHTQIEQHINYMCKGNFDTSFIVHLEEWLDSQILGWLRQLYAGRQTASQLTWVDAFRDRLRHYIYETYAKSLISQFFDIIIDYPDSKPAIEDLSECMQKTDLRKELVTDLRTALENRLLHPGVNTADILTAYIAAIKSLRLLEPAGVILELVCEPVSRYLRSREDTVRCIVAGLTDEGNNELVNELVKSKPTGEEEAEDESGTNWEEWKPDPVDADPSTASKVRRSADILSTLVNIYGSKELCFNEYRALLADRILSHYHCDVERELRYLELLKLRFGEGPLHFCEVMLRDVTESRRVNSRIQESRKQDKTAEDPDMNAMILSAQFWPAFRDEKVKLPEELQSHLDRYTKDFEAQKQNRTMVWKPHLGTMNIELELKDETLNFSVSPVQAAIIMKFQAKTKWSVDELCSELEMTPTVLRRKIAFWQSQGLLRETSPDLYILVEERRGRPHDLIMVEEEEVESAMASAQQQKEEEMQVFWTYIQGMLANMHCLSLERIHSMLKMFAMNEQGSAEVTLKELKKFLDNKVKNQQLTFIEGVYRLNK